MSRLVIAFFICAPSGLIAWGSWRSATNRTSFAGQGHSFAKRNKCIVESRFVPTLDQRFREQKQAAALGVGASAIIYLPIALVDDRQSLFIVFPLIIAATGLVRSLHICWQSSHSGLSDPGTGRVARLRSVSAGDLVSPWVRAVAWMAAAATAVAAAVAVFGDVERPWAWALVVAAGLAVGCQLIVDGTARWVAAQPEQAEDSAHLYWQDAFRAGALSEAYLSSALAAGLAMMVVWPPAFGLPFWVGVTPMACATALVLVTSHFGRLRFRRRLWGWLGPDEVIPPGRTLVPR